MHYRATLARCQDRSQPARRAMPTKSWITIPRIIDNMEQTIQARNDRKLEDRIVHVDL